MSRLIYTQVSKNKKKKYFRLTCLNQLYSWKQLDKHSELCRDNESVVIAIPDDEDEFISGKYDHIL